MYMGSDLNFDKLPPEMLEAIFSELPKKEQGLVRLVNKQSAAIIEAMQSVGEKNLEMREKIDNYRAQVKSIDKRRIKYETKINELDRTIKDLTVNVENKENELRKIRGSFLGKVVRFFRRHSVLDKTIGKIFKCFASVQQVFNREVTLEKEITGLRNDIDQHMQKSISKRNKMTHLKVEAELDLKFRRQAIQLHEKVMNIFGGRDAFLKLPVLNKEGEIFNIENGKLNIRPDDVTAPIMRGTTPSGEEFFIIKAKGLNNHGYIETEIQLFLNHEFDGGLKFWYPAAGDIIDKERQRTLTVDKGKNLKYLEELITKREVYIKYSSYNQVIWTLEE